MRDLPSWTLFCLQRSVFHQTKQIIPFLLDFSLTEINEFQKIVGGFIDMVDSLAKEVEKEKMKVPTYIYL